MGWKTTLEHRGNGEGEWPIAGARFDAEYGTPMGNAEGRTMKQMRSWAQIIDARIARIYRLAEKSHRA